MYPPAQLDSTSDYATATGGPATITYNAVANYSHCISGIAFSYSTTLTTSPGTLTITDGGQTIFSIDITAPGAGFIEFNPAKKASVNSAMVITLTTGGTSIVGKVSVLGHWTRAAQ